MSIAIYFDTNFHANTNVSINKIKINHIDGSGSSQCIGLSDIRFIEENNVPYDTERLFQDRFSTAISDVLDHRRIQEELMTDYGYKSDQKAWNKNCKIIHEYNSGKYDK